MHERRLDVTAADPFERLRTLSHEFEVTKGEIKERLSTLIDKAHDPNELIQNISFITHAVEAEAAPRADVALPVTAKVYEAGRRGRKPMFATDDQRKLARRDYHKMYQRDRRAAHKLGVDVEEYRAHRQDGTLHQWLENLTKEKTRKTSVKKPKARARARA